MISSANLYANIWNDIYQRFLNNKLHHALLFNGQIGLGKFNFAYELAKTLLCENHQNHQNHQNNNNNNLIATACNNCKSCQLFNTNNHPDLRLVIPENLQNNILENKNTKSEKNDKNDKSDKSEKKSTSFSKNILIEQVRELSDFLVLTTNRKGLRIIIIYPAETMNNNCANALLKSLEEPLPQTLFLLITNKIGQLLPTLKSRCEIINFALPNQQNTLSWLKLLPNIANKNNAEINSALAYCNQSPLLAEQILNTNFLNNTTWLKQFLQALEKPKQIDFIALSAIIEKESKNSDSNAINSAMNFSLILLCDVLQKWLVDLILLYYLNNNKYFINYKKSQQELIKNTNINIKKLLQFWNEVIILKKQSLQPLNSRIFIEDLFMKYRNIFKNFEKTL